jgi:phospholipase C
MLVVSPFSAGGWVCSDVFDHTSQLQFLASLFNVRVPNVSEWRRSAVGNLMSTLPVLDKPDVEVPKIAAVSDDQSAPPIGDECSSEQILELDPDNGAYPVPGRQKLPRQAPGHLRSTPALAIGKGRR